MLSQIISNKRWSHFALCKKCMLQHVCTYIQHNVYILMLLWFLIVFLILRCTQFISLFILHSISISFITQQFPLCFFAETLNEKDIYTWSILLDQYIWDQMEVKPGSKSHDLVANAQVPNGTHSRISWCYSGYISWVSKLTSQSDVSTLQNTCSLPTSNSEILKGFHYSSANCKGKQFKQNNMPFS